MKGCKMRARASFWSSSASVCAELKGWRAERSSLFSLNICILGIIQMVYWESASTQTCLNVLTCYLTIERIGSCFKIVVYDLVIWRNVERKVLISGFISVRDTGGSNLYRKRLCVIIISVSTRLRLCSQTCCNRALVSSSGLDSDESCEGGSESSFKDALADGGSQKNNGSMPQKNGMKKHRYCCIPAPRICWSQVKTAWRSCLGHSGSL